MITLLHVGEIHQTNILLLEIHIHGFATKHLKSKQMSI